MDHTAPNGNICAPNGNVPVPALPLLLSIVIDYRFVYVNLSDGIENKRGYVPSYVSK